MSQSLLVLSRNKVSGPWLLVLGSQLGRCCLRGLRVVRSLWDSAWGVADISGLAGVSVLQLWGRRCRRDVTDG